HNVAKTLQVFARRHRDRKIKAVLNAFVDDGGTIGKGCCQLMIMKRQTRDMKKITGPYRHKRQKYGDQCLSPIPLPRFEFNCLLMENENHKEGNQKDNRRRNLEQKQKSEKNAKDGGIYQRGVGTPAHQENPSKKNKQRRGSVRVATLKCAIRAG